MTSNNHAISLFSGTGTYIRINPGFMPREPAPHPEEADAWNAGDAGVNIFSNSAQK
jgi:hypothetical protein